MRILVLGNNRIGWKCVEWLREQDEEIVGLALHPPERRRFGPELITAAGPATLLDGWRLREPEVLERVADLNPDIALSLLFGYILTDEFLALFPKGVVNLHPSLLPYNRGQYPNVWSIIDGTPSGVTLHHVDAGIDTGDIIAQREVPVEAWDTGETLYGRLESAAVELFKATWPAIRDDVAPRFPQREGGTFHRTRDVDAIDRIDPDREYRAGDLLDILRARTFPPYKGAYFLYEGRKVHLRLELIPEDPADGGHG